MVQNGEKIKNARIIYGIKKLYMSVRMYNQAHRLQSKRSIKIYLLYKMVFASYKRLYILQKIYNKKVCANASLLCPVATVTTTMAVSTILVTTATGGQVQRTMAVMHGTAT